MTILRNIAAVLLGLVVGSMLNMAIIELNTSVFFPAPPGMDFNDPEAFSAYMAELPAAAFLVVMVAHLTQAFVGGLIAAFAGKTRPMMLSMIVGGFTMLGGIMAFMMFDSPAWMLIEMPLYIVCAWGAGRIAQGGSA